MSGRLPASRDNDEPADGHGLAPRRADRVLPFGIEELDRKLQGGLRVDALHEIRGRASRNGAATGFALALVASLARRDDRPVLWIAETVADREAGNLYGPGLTRFGLPEGHLVMAHVRHPADALWVFEEGLRCRGLSAVVAEIRGHPRPLDLTASRRLALRARDNGVMGLLLRQIDQPDPGAALTCWQVTPRPAGITDRYPGGIGQPAWQVVLERNRRGATGAFDLEWDHVRRAFSIPAIASKSIRPFTPLSGPVAAPAGDRSSAPAEAGQVMAFAARTAP